MSVGDIYGIFVRFDSDALEGKECHTIEIVKTNLTVVLLWSILGLPPALGSTSPASGFNAKNVLNSSYFS